MAYDFNTTYALDPWDVITTNQRTWYDGLLRERYIRNAVFSPHVTMKVDTNAMRSKTIVFNDLIPPSPYVGDIGNRTMNATRLYTDAFQRQLTVHREGNGMAIHKESELFNYWEQNGDYGLREIINQSMAQVIVDHIDSLAFRSFLTNPFANFGLGTASGFGGVNVTADLMQTDLLDAVWLGMNDRRVPWAAPGFPVTFGTDEILCLCSPGNIYDLRREVANGQIAANKFVNVQEYANPEILLQAGEVGTYRGVRFIQNPMCELWNCGTVATQTTITASVNSGDGAPDPTTTKVDNVRYVGQPAATHSITVASTTGFKVGDIVTITQLLFSLSSGLGLTNPGNGVVNGVDYTDPMLQNMQIVSIPDSTHLVFKTPYMKTDLNGNGLTTDLGSGVKGYVTKGSNVHVAIFLNNNYNQGVIAGYAQPPRIYTPPPVDDFLSIYRLTYDMWVQYQLWEPGVFQVAFLGGSAVQNTNVFIR